ncbi:hypothetical protein MLD38_014799 [Melastoma candidum]|uniref:Uncharacterized protein n=1 Tax=Melastoma candidum TaxID=119954 RepID=A0ACB9RDT8_9MYRT|nr:hypothetical protein MLD38_014799 [Melastoma candidum]
MEQNSKHESLVTFALSYGGWSCPAVRVYTASKVEDKLESSKRDILRAALGISKVNQLMRLKMLDWYLLDFVEDMGSLLNWVCLRLSDEIQLNQVFNVLDLYEFVGAHEGYAVQDQFKELPKMSDNKLSHSPNPADSLDPMQLGQDSSPIPRRELHSLVLPLPLGPNTPAELSPAVIPPTDHGDSPLEITGDVVVIGDGESVGIEGDDGGGRKAEDALVAAAPGVLDDEVAGKVLGLFRGESGGGGRGGSAWR